MEKGKFLAGMGDGSRLLENVLKLINSLKDISDKAKNVKRQSG